jgi:lactoylglutathione lyase
MRLDHVAIYTNDLERLKHFYTTYFDAHAGQLYDNAAKGFRSYFLEFVSESSRSATTSSPMVLKSPVKQSRSPIWPSPSDRNLWSMSYAALTSRGYTVVGQPRTTGDGYYESVVLDPDGNRHLSPHRQSSFLALNSLCVCLFLGWRKKE